MANRSTSSFLKIARFPIARCRHIVFSSQSQCLLIKQSGFLLCLLIVLFQSGCSSHADRVWSVREAYFSGRLAEAHEQTDIMLKKHKREADAFLLDKAMIELAAGRPKSCERILRGVRNRFDELEEADAREVAASMLTDDTRRAYAGEDYEKVLIRAMLALSNLMTDGTDASAYALQMVDKQQQIIEAAMEKQKKDEEGPPPELAYKQVALGPYIRAMLAEESPLTLDEAARARVQVANWEPSFRDAKADVERASFAQPIAQGNGVLYVFTLVGRGPVLQEKEEIPTQAAMLVADRILDVFAKRSVVPTVAPVKVPQVVRFPSTVDAVSVRVDGQLRGQTATLVDVGTMAVRQQEAHYTEVIARAVVRRTLKKGALYAVQEVADVDKGSLLSLGVMLAGIAWEATENADTRCWSLLPDKIQVLRIELPVGDHEISLRPASHGGEFASSARTKVSILDGRNTYLLGTIPTSQFVGELLTNTPAEQ